MPIAVKAENLSKRYIIAHQQAEYQMLRDKLAQQGLELGKRLLHPLRSSRGEPMADLAGSEEFWALRDVHFDIQVGEVVGIIGRNGAGKSTLLKILSRVTEPTSGFIAIKGKVNSLLEVGTGFHGELTGRENVFLNGSILGMTKTQIKSRFDQIVAFAEIEQFLDTPMKRYSSGMQVRLAFSIATHLDSEVLIVDEVLAVGDTAFQKKCLGKMHEFASREGRTILFVSHTMATVQDFCSRCLLLQKGRIVAEGEPKQVIGEYLGTLNESEPDASDYLVPAEEHAFIRKLRISSRIAGLALAGEPFSVEVVFDNLARCPAPELELSFENADGMKIFTVRKDLMEARDFFSHHGRASLTWEVRDLPLLPGRYWLSCALLPGPREKVQPLDRALVFSVTNPQDQSALHGNAPARGLISVRGQWSAPTINE